MKLCLDVREQFCPHCGQHTLHKVAYTVDSNGIVQFHAGDGRPNLRGTIFTVPKPKGGRTGDLIVSQGQMSRKEQLGAASTAPEAARFGHGRRNPNEARKRIGKKSATKRKR